MLRDRYLQEDQTSGYKYPSVWLSTLPRKKPTKQKVVISLPEHALAKRKKIKILRLPEGEDIWVFSTETKHATALGTVNPITSSNLQQPGRQVIALRKL